MTLYVKHAYLLFRYGAELFGIGEKIPILPGPVHWLLLIVLATIFLSAVFFAPKLNNLSAAIVLFALLAPLYTYRFMNLSLRIQPIAIAIVTLVPGLIAVLISFPTTG